MFSDDELRKIEEMLERTIDRALEARGLKKPPSAAALRMQRMRERLRNASVTGRNGASQSVTVSPEKRNGSVTKRNGAHHPAVDDSPIAITFLLNDGSEFEIRESIVKEFEQLYPQCDVPQTLREIKGWCLANQQKRKTRAGALKFVNGWLAREQNKG